MTLDLGFEFGFRGPRAELAAPASEGGANKQNTTSEKSIFLVLVVQSRV